MEMAIQAGCVSVLVLSGEATLDSLKDSGKNVDLVIQSVNDLLQE